MSRLESTVPPSRGGSPCTHVATTPPPPSDDNAPALPDSPEALAAELERLRAEGKRLRDRTSKVEKALREAFDAMPERTAVSVAGSYTGTYAQIVERSQAEPWTKPLIVNVCVEAYSAGARVGAEALGDPELVRQRVTAIVDIAAQNRPKRQFSTVEIREPPKKRTASARPAAARQ